MLIRTEIKWGTSEISAVVCMIWEILVEKGDCESRLLCNFWDDRKSRIWYLDGEGYFWNNYFEGKSSI